YRQGASGGNHRQLSVHRRAARAKYEYRGPLARRTETCGGESGSGGHAEKGESAAGSASLGMSMADSTAEKSPRPEKIFPVSWDQFHRDSRALAWRLHEAGPFEAIVCITRGGLVPAAIVARELNVRMIETVSVLSYRDYKNQGDVKVLKDVGSSIVNVGGGKGKGVLIV